MKRNDAMAGYGAPEIVTKTVKMVATNATHLAKLLKADTYPG